MAANSDRIKGPWSPEEDDLLQNLVQKHGPRNWSVISKSISGRSGKSCRLRWCNQLSPQVEHRAFTPEEDETKYGPSSAIWFKICLNPGSPSGSDVSDWSLPAMSVSRVYKPVARAGVILLETAPSDDDPPTGLSLSLPGAESISHKTEPTQSETNPVHLLPVLFTPAVMQRPEKVFMPFGAELMAVMQEMIRAEVRNYMMGLEQEHRQQYYHHNQANVNEGFRNATTN